MSARSDAHTLLQQWGELSQSEALSINAASWADVGRIQAAKTALQSTLADALKMCLNGSEAVTLPPDDPLRVEAARLLSLEGRNAELLAEQFRRTQAERELQQESLRNLRKLRRSYGRKPNS